jgi:hypothetical protein
MMNPLVAFWITMAPMVDQPVEVYNPPSSSEVVVPILEVVKLYGKLAGPTCFGKTAPKGSSCQITRQDFDRVFPETHVSKENLQVQMEQLNFQWPLKPYGVEKSESQTAVMNKGAETSVYMDELEQRSLFDKRNPTGPLPTSLRPDLNRLLQEEGISRAAIDLLYERLSATKDFPQSSAEALFRGQDAIDWYDFLDVLGKNSISWGGE